jgi:calcineurin-like phosphoesterase family protein
MKIFLTADEHYGHTNIIKYCNRPFESVEEMDAVLIKNNNKIVEKNDTVYHLGDFTLKTNLQIAEEYISRLTGKHIFLKGSHDYWAEKNNKNLPYIIEKKINKYYIVMCHYAMRTWPRSFHGSLLAYGHSHGKLPSFKNAHDVGVDNNNFYPVLLDDFIKICSQK